MFKIDVNETQVLTMLTEKMKMPHKIAVLFKELVAPRMRQSFQQNFASEGRSPHWELLKDDTKDDRRKKGFYEGPILWRTGKLAESVINAKESTDVFSNMVSMTIPGDINSMIDYYKYHQLGTRKMDQRKMIMFQPDDVEYILRVLNDRLQTGEL